MDGSVWFVTTKVSPINAADLIVLYIFILRKKLGDENKALCSGLQIRVCT